MLAASAKCRGVYAVKGSQRDSKGLSFAIEQQARSTAVGLIALLFRPEPLVAGVGYWVIPVCRRSKPSDWYRPLAA